MPAWISSSICTHGHSNGNASATATAIQDRKGIQMQKITEQEWMQLGTPAGLVYLSTEGMQQQHKSGDH